MVTVELCLYVCPRAECLGFLHWLRFDTGLQVALRVHQWLFNVVGRMERNLFSSQHW